MATLLIMMALCCYYGLGFAMGTDIIAVVYPKPNRLFIFPVAAANDIALCANS